MMMMIIIIIIERNVANHLVQSFVRFAGASYAWYVNVRSGTVGDK